MQRSAAAARIASGVPPIPTAKSIPDPGRAAAIADATSPSESSSTRAPTARICSMRFACRADPDQVLVESLTTRCQ